MHLASSTLYISAEDNVFFSQFNSALRKVAELEQVAHATDTPSSGLVHICVSYFKIKPTNYMKQNISECHSANSEIPSHLLWNTKDHYHVHHSQPLHPILNKINAAHTIASFLKIHFNIILPSKRRLSKLSPAFRYSDKMYSFKIPHSCYMPGQYYPPWRGHSINIWWNYGANH
jgi:hypothetical protein